MEAVEFLLRWVHFLAGITWIGVLYYFNFIQTPFFKGAEPAVRSGMIRGLVPSALAWFRWGAMFTFLTGLTMIGLRMSAGVTHDSAYMTLIFTGALMGTLMWYNVWFIIWPAQKVVIASAEQVAAGGEAIPEAAAKGARAGMASRTNTLFSFPMLFFMGAATHMTGLGAGKDPADPQLMTYWAITITIILLMEVNGAFLGAGKPTQKLLTSVVGVIHAGLGLTLVLFLVAKYAL